MDKVAGATKRIDGSILKWLEHYDQRIVSFTLSDKMNSVEIREECDGYFSVTLNKAEFGRMVEELRDIHAQMME